MSDSSGVKMTEELRREIEKLENLTAEEIDDPRVNELLLKGAKEHAEVLRRSRELGNRRIYKD